MKYGLNAYRAVYLAYCIFLFLPPSFHSVASLPATSTCYFLLSVTTSVSPRQSFKSPISDDIIHPSYLFHYPPLLAHVQQFHTILLSSGLVSLLSCPTNFEPLFFYSFQFLSFPTTLFSPGPEILFRFG